MRMKQCNKCKGRGAVLAPPTYPPKRAEYVSRVKCEACGGTGKVAVVPPTRRGRSVMRTHEQRLRKIAEARFIGLLNQAIDAAYEADIENRGDVLTLPIVELYRSITARGTPTR